MRAGKELRYPSPWNKNGKEIVDDLLYWGFVRRKVNKKSRDLVLTPAGREALEAALAE